MILAIDIGNTNIVIGCITQDKISFVERVSTDISKTELEYVVEFKTLLELYKVKMKEITGCIIASVVPPLNNIVKNAMEKLFHISPLLVGPGVKTGLNILMDNPGQVGSDLIVNAVAGLKYYGAPIIMIDMGTATTISVVDKNKNYIGGMILPGVKVSLESLVDRTSQLPRISLEAPKKVIGTNTIDCMKSGIIMGQAACIDGMIDRIWDELGYQAPVVATGGLACHIVPCCKKKITCDNELTLKGLEIIYKKNMDLKA
ncbi:type III pantothenate kinase [Parablautia intestinalis]|jgi:type III pantothenate kinase|uniref:Type III pantothenate kinase n=1 Tax=Parablautia intestinalis TaxID=2320100 RepID=A0A3A9AMU6_9FIRM|nr:type III pantothenate kinase [Parablautia intestinalis]MCI8616519.1 type III pantothenate kinase [Lachnospiraceae bacterium]MDE7048600.1 type III pantothenate kinase [Lachnospiraceae bacterium]RKI92717.1 type III pantothenate kinase [Parablautia intestinalis]